MTYKPVIYVEDREPDAIGAHGRAWKSTRKELETTVQRYPNLPPAELTIASWVVEAPYAHPFWHSYVVGCISLRDLPGAPKSKIHLKGATHEVLVYALDPDHRRPLNDSLHFLTSSNFHGQWIASSDKAAELYIDETVQLIVDGKLSPDTDYRRQWIARFSDSNLQRGPSKAS